jgi:A/G-specific adenine glycosylase
MKPVESGHTPTLSPEDIRAFREVVLTHYRDHRREMPWRDTEDPYHILLSEVMLQQTQVERVVMKYREFLERFPDLGSLARASVTDVLRVWQGLGYNRRALMLAKTARYVLDRHRGILPDDPEELARLPGIGKTTAGAIAAFAFRRATLLIETNIRRVYIHHFFEDREGVKDREILPLLAQTLDSTNPRDWYYALMDYGSSLRKEVINPNRKSAHYRRQPAFDGSDRKVRGNVIRNLLRGSPQSLAQMSEDIGVEQERLRRVLMGLVKEGFVNENRGVYGIREDAPGSGGEKA